jgi:dTDP-glucose 4,6-dehydratase
MSKVLITGGAGFIGSHAVDYFLQKGHKVVVVDSLSYSSNMKNLSEAEKNGNFSFFHADITNETKMLSLLQKHKPKWIINFAAETHVDNSINDNVPFIHTNILGVNNLLTCCKIVGKIKFCQISTDEVYGPANKKPFKETSKLNPMNPYSATKTAAEHLVKSFHNTYGIKYLILRPSNNYGPRQYREKFIPNSIRCLMNGDRIPVYGNGSQQREWLYVQDSVKIIHELIFKGRINNTYNIGTTQSMMKNIEVIENILNCMSNKSLEDVVNFVKDRPGHDKKYWISHNKTYKILKEFQKTSFSDGIRETIQYYENIF